MLKKIFVAALLLALVFAGCATREKTKKSAVENVKETNEAQVEKKDYYVKKGDTLWDIASRYGVYGDPFKWPLIYKANRDIINDPDLIYPDQDFDIKKGYPEEEVEEAVKQAEDYPPYRPGSKPAGNNFNY